MSRKAGAIAIAAAIVASVFLLSGEQAKRLLTIGDEANGRVLVVHVGARVDITLHQSTWTFLPPTGNGEVQQSRQQVVRQAGSCSVIDFCGSVSVQVVGIAPGRSSVRATRELCGELVMCNAQSGSYRLVLRVRP